MMMEQRRHAADSAFFKHCARAKSVAMGLGLNPDFPLGASSTLFERWRRIFGHFFRSSLKIASYFRLIQVKTASKSASTIISNPNGNSGLKTSLGFALGLMLLAGLSDQTYAQTQAQTQTQPQPQTIATADGLQHRVKACVACHGQEGRATTDGFYPRIAGKPAGYLFNQLRHFRDGTRVYPMMTYMVAHMNDAYLKEIADYFAALNPPYAAPQSNQASTTEMERGRTLVKIGDAGRKLPACVACHGDKMTGVAPFIPGLLGLPRDYLVAQLGAWKTGSRHAASPDCMQTVAKQLDASDIAAVSAWLAAQNIPADTKAITPTKDFSLPITCGSIKP